MRKAGMTICFIFIFIIIYLLQANLFGWFNLAGVKPNLFIIFILTISLFSSKEIGTIFGIFFGLVLDFLIGKSIGICSIMFGAIGIMGGYLGKNFSKDSRITMIMMIAVATFIYEMGTITFNFFIHQTGIGIFYLLKTLIIEILYNSIIAIILYPLIIKFGYKIEEVFKTNKMFTRYF